MTNQNKIERLTYLDTSRGFALLCVVLGHIFNDNNIVIKWIYSFHIPLFFIISGCLLYHKSSINKRISELIISRIKSLIIPYISFCMINIIFEILLNGYEVTIKWTAIQTITLFGIGATWFLPALFISEITFILIQKNIKQKLIKVLLLITIFFIPFIFKYDHILVKVLLRILTATGFISIGYYGFKYIKNINISKKQIIFVLLMNFLISQMNGNVDLYLLRYNNPIFYTINSILGSVVIILLFKMFNKLKFKYLTYIGINSIIIMATHQNIIRLMHMVIDKKINNFINYIVIFTITLLIELPIIYIINNYMPWILGKFKNNDTVKLELN